MKDRVQIASYCTDSDGRFTFRAETTRCTASKMVGRRVQTDESSVWVGPLRNGALPIASEHEIAVAAESLTVAMFDGS